MRAVIPRDPNLAPFDYEQRRLADLGVAVSFCGLTEAEMVAAAADAEVLFNAGNRLSAPALAQLRVCRLIAFYGIGVDAIDVPAATALGIVVANTPFFGVEEVADHALALLLACSRQLLRADRLVRGGGWRWDDLRPLRSLRGSTVGIIGLGNIGRAFAQRVMALGCDVLYFDPLLDGPPIPGPRPAPLDHLLSAADFVSIHAPRTPRTTGLLGERELRLMKPTAYLVNTARGPIIREHALVNALRERWIAGAALDVFEVEPPAADNPLLQLDNVLLSPHMASYTEQAWARLKEQACDAVERVARGEWPRHVVNRDVSPRVPLRLAPSD